MVEVFALEGSSESASASAPAAERIAPVMSGARTMSASADSAHNKDITADSYSRLAQKKARGPRRVRVGMSDLHSSIKDGCLM
jgi:protein arginine N-methyltransferase 5